MLQILRLSRSGRDVSRFLRAPYAIYAGDPFWVAPLLADLKKVFTDANPLLSHADMQLWVATRDGRDLGRIMGLVDRSHNEFHKERTAFFGFFESVDRPDVAAGLLHAVGQWAADRGMDRILGPMNPTSNDECGLLVEGFDGRPAVMMPYNPRYYPALLEGAGLAKARDLLAYRFDLDRSAMERMVRLADAHARRGKAMHFRRIRRRTLREDLLKVREVYNSAWSENWGFVPMTVQDTQFMAERLKPLLCEDLAYLAESDGEAVAFFLAMPDYNEAIQPLRGRLLSLGLPRFLSYLFGWRMPEGVRLMVMGVKKSFRQRGADLGLVARAYQESYRLGFRWCEASWILEDNRAVRSLLEHFDAKVYRRYRIYERPSGGAALPAHA